MYHQYFGLNEAPFSIAVNPRYLFMSARHRDALAHLLYGVGAGGGFILLTGEVGTGKTTINRCLLEQLPDDTDVAIILNPALNALELLASACDELDINYDAQSHSLKTLTDQLHAFLLENHSRGRKTVLMIDEAQHLDFDVLEQIRLLTNLETNSEKLLQIILIGQPELAQLLNRPELRQLSQRITARYNLGPLDLDETRAYIRHRLEVAGLAPGREIFPKPVVVALFKRTRGIPRLINVLCDRVLLGAYGQNKLQADRKMLETAAKEVMGEEPVAGKSKWRRGMLIALVVLLLIGTGAGLVAGIMWLQSTGMENDPPPLAATTVMAPVEEARAEAPVPVQPPAQPATPQYQRPAWLLSPGKAMSGLWAITSPYPMPADGCSGDVYHNVVCVAGSAQTWGELQQFDRPVVLDMISRERFSASVMLLGIEGRTATVLANDSTNDSVAEASLAELGPSWTGGYRFLWRPPSGFTGPVSIGDVSPVVAEVAQLFAQLDGQRESLATNTFNAALEQRVVLFQRQHNLEDDGVVGMQTLLKLNELLAIDVGNAEARRLLVSGPGEAVNR